MRQHNVHLNSRSGKMRLIPPAPDYDAEISVLRSHEGSRRHLQFFPPNISPEEVAKRREERAEDPKILDFYILSLEDNGGQVLGGMTGIFHIDTLHNSCEVGIMVHPEIHGRNIATDALYTLLEYVFEERKFHRATFETSAENIPMRNWLEKVAGARLEAERRECWKLGEDTYGDVRGYSILGREWKSEIRNRLQRRLGLVSDP